MYTLYMHKFPNNKVYIGITSKPVEVRWRNVYNRYFTNAVDKYGWDNIQHIILAENLSKKWACKLEQDLIWKYQSNNRKYGYNITSGGDGGWGHHVSKDARKKIGSANSRALRGRKLSETTKQKISAATKGKIVSDETRKKLREANLGRVSPNKGVPMSQEQKEKISNARKGFIMSQQQKDKLRLAHLGKVTSEDTKKKLSRVSRGRYYVNNGVENKRVFEYELDDYLNRGYVRGIVHTDAYNTKKNCSI